MKNVWILNHYATAPNDPGGTRHFGLSQHMRDHGWDSSLIAASVGHGHGSQRQRLEGRNKQRLDIIEGVRFLWLRTPTYRGNGVDRMVNMLAYSWRALLPSATRILPRPDVIIGSSVHPFAAVSGALLARRFDVPFVFEVRDLWPQTLIDMGRLKQHSLMAKVMRMIERWLYRRADKIIVLLPRAGEYIESLEIDSGKAIWLPNGVELDETAPPKLAANRDDFTVMYFGAHGDANGLDNILKAFALLEQRSESEKIVLRLIGDGPAKASLMVLANELGIKRVSFENSVPKKQIPDLAGQADAFVFNLIDAPVFNYGISSNKLYDYLAAARPIVFSCNAANNPVEEAQAGITVPPASPEALADAVEMLAAMPAEQRAKMGKAGRAYVETNHSYRQLGRKLAFILDEIIDSNGRS